MTTSTKVNSFKILKTKNQFILLCWKKKSRHMCTNFWINPHNGKLPRRLAPAQCQNSLAPQLLSNDCWSKTKTSISLNRVYWYDTICHIFSCCLMVPPFKKAENNLFQFCFTLRKCFVFVSCRHFTTLKWLKVLQLSKICLNMVKAMTPKTTDQNILFLNERIPFNLYCRFNECGIKLLILIN